MPTPARDHPTAALETRLRSQFKVQDVTFRHGEHCFELMLPVSADDLIDESRFERDEYMPYWAELWPAGVALTRWLLDNDPQEERAIELGCGIALPTIALDRHGIPTIATDWSGEGLAFASVNLQRNGCTSSHAAHLDWHEAIASIAPSPLVVASDVLYERRNVALLFEIMPRVVADGGRFVLADPGRFNLERFLKHASERGWATEFNDVLHEPPQSSIRLFVFRRRRS